MALTTLHVVEVGEIRGFEILYRTLGPMLIQKEHG